MSNDFGKVYSRSLNDPESFWSEAAESIHWEKRWDTVLDESNPPFYRWFLGGVLNTCYNAVDLHVETFGTTDTRPLAGEQRTSRAVMSTLTQTTDHPYGWVNLNSMRRLRR